MACQTTLAHKAEVARQTIRSLKDAVKRIAEGSFGECAQCGAEIESKRLEAIPWARYCVRCQEARGSSGDACCVNPELVPRVAAVAADLPTRVKAFTTSGHVDMTGAQKPVLL